MKKFDIGQIVGLIANLGVIAGLVFLAVEVRHARTATELQTISDVTNGWFVMNEAVATDPQVAGIFVKGLYQPDSLSTIEAAQFSMYLRMFVNQVKRVWQHRELGLISDADYQSVLQELAQFLQTPGGQKWWDNEPLSNEYFLEDLQHYFGTDPTTNLLLDRDPSSIE
jgi:hypothetical protein